MHPLMNNTKWDELWSMPLNVPGPLEWRVKYLKSGIVSAWSTNWEKTVELITSWKDIEWMEIRFHNNKDEIIEDLKKVYVPGAILEESIRIYGYCSHCQHIDYL